MDVKERIILGSVELMNREGVRKTTMDNVAHHLGISKRTIYENFSDKVGLIEAVVDHRIKSTEESHAEIIAKSTDTMDGLFKMLGGIENDFSMYGRIVMDVRRHYPEIFMTKFVKHYEHTYTSMIDGLQKGVKEGLILDNVNIEFSVFSIMETINTLMQNTERMLTTTNVSAVQAFRHVMLYFFRGIATAPGIEKIDKYLTTNN